MVLEARALLAKLKLATGYVDHMRYSSQQLDGLSGSSSDIGLGESKSMLVEDLLLVVKQGDRTREGG